ncbi:putative DSBA family oxidoreductase [Athelia psychrophila]|uniref:DSBA family oxidoreductase n=1 Tax=Athelia psychrophila TaxID=1759441 RepID=A0A167U6Z6_9AGAM|nr:putative DSBA family oxidoreductase [Fibularhizoctonia sp. CBS 109695]
MGGKIDCYLDCTSFYGYLTFQHLLKERETLRSHGVEVEFFPVFLGGINVLSGNKPPWSLPAKAAYAVFDGTRAKKHFATPAFDAPAIRTPDFFPILSILPQRAMAYIKDHFAPAKFEEVFMALFPALWVPPQTDLSVPVNFEVRSRSILLVLCPSAAIMAGASPAYKQKLTDLTKKVVDEQGAFGCPWFWVTKFDAQGGEGTGTGEPFFGSDRFHFMWEHLGLPWEDVRLLPKGATARL